MRCLAIAFLVHAASAQTQVDPSVVDGMTFYAFDSALNHCYRIVAGPGGAMTQNADTTLGNCDATNFGSIGSIYRIGDYDSTSSLTDSYTNGDSDGCAAPRSATLTMYSDSSVSSTTASASEPSTCVYAVVITGPPSAFVNPAQACGPASSAVIDYSAATHTSTGSFASGGIKRWGPIGTYNGQAFDITAEAVGGNYVDPTGNVQSGMSGSFPFIQMSIPTATCSAEAAAAGGTIDPNTANCIGCSSSVSCVTQVQGSYFDLKFVETGTNTQMPAFDNVYMTFYDSRPPESMRETAPPPPPPSLCAAAGDSRGVRCHAHISPPAVTCVHLSVACCS